jgi:hypothetical protein
MPIQLPQVGKVYRSVRDLPLVNNTHVARLSHGPPILTKGTEVEITAVLPKEFELNCKDGQGTWGLKIRIAKVIFGTTFEPL